MEAVEKKVGITKKGTASNELQITTSNPEKRGHEPGSESVNEAKAEQNDPQEPSSSKDPSLVIENEPEEKPPEQSGEPSVLVLEKGVSADSDLQKGETRRQRKRDAAMVHVRGKSEVGQGYDPFVPFDTKMSKLLTDWVKLDPYFKTPMAKKPRRCPSRFYFTLRTPLEWLNDGWSHKYPKFKSDEGDINGLGRRLPVNFRNEHWIATWISIPKSHIVVWDIILTHIKAADLDVLMEPFVNIVPYLLVECTGSDEERVKHTLEPYTYERVTVGIPQCRSSDCGVFALKYIECHALGMSFPPEFCNKNAKAIREKMALDIFKETPEGHAKENEDNDENLGTYDEQGSG
ncbi:hypothetical protein DY000_02053598 [Brassica cretica]|uniref:Ubiquitin-like protease family profile domain-containing protein n=1 Tax=Brassica cretica TaxID=69181 RepID=A0ABQ7A9J1_BRACR|nr:hypothetical protein DY000_02053598 [Brassica cretica]